MNKESFLKILKNGLNDFPEGELSDILFYYKDYFDSAIEQGKNYDEIINELGDPYDIVKNYRYNKENPILSQSIVVSDSSDNSQDSGNFKSKNNYEKNSYINKKKNNHSSNLIVSLLIIALSFILLGPSILGAVGVIGSIFLAVIVSSFSLSVAGTITLIGKVVHGIGLTILPEFIVDFPNSVLAFSVLGSIFLFVFSVLLLYYFIKLLIHLSKKFFNWSSRKIRGKDNGKQKNN
ncbi:MAG: DUF1700 domain-containing protein [Clostridium sp.]|uniref:DUF1700 domain-containing protein n=1 Tax=Clostridium sp. TaxID=1506 RepID=UPI00290FA14C|nr:DUF1700 domain-containing protein [Clostridium sp.]MDU5111141.1 DUF1700 domain-containing protein [Clostridium sp.]